jgi:hypothetical protein
MQLYIYIYIYIYSTAYTDQSTTIRLSYYQPAPPRYHSASLHRTRYHTASIHHLVIILSAYTDQPVYTDTLISLH